MRILIAGCGYVGTALGKVLISQGAKVWGLRRDAEALSALASEGIQPIAADLLDPKTLEKLPDVDAVVFCQALSRKTDNYFETYTMGTRNLVAAYRSHPPQRMVMISSTSVFSTNDGSWVTEQTSPAAVAYDSQESTANAQALLEAEAAVLLSKIPAVVFRLAGIYGPGRHRIGALKAGRMKPSLSEAYTNRIHREDIVSGMLLLLEKGVAGEIYIGADDCPTTQKEFYSWLCGQIGMKIPEPAAEASSRGHVSNKRCSNQKIKELGLKLKYPSYREGYSEILRQEAIA